MKNVFHIAKEPDNEIKVDFKEALERLSHSDSSDKKKDYNSPRELPKFIQINSQEGDNNGILVSNAEGFFVDQ